MSLRTEKTERTIISGISGYIRKGEVTALMGTTGAGKTTLLNVLAHRAPAQVSGDILHDGRKPSRSFQRLVGYAQQNDIHLPTATVREALIFSAQSRISGVDASHAAQIADEVIDLTELVVCADAVIGMPGEGLNLEQRRRLTIAVELAAQPSGILFLDEPTSNLDGQTAWSICALLRRLAASNYAVLCTVHQPSGSLLGLFDNLLLLGNDGKQLYFGQLGYAAENVINYFTRGGAREISESENPAEWMLQVTEKAPPTAPQTTNWADFWSTSGERSELMASLEKASATAKLHPEDPQHQPQGEFAISFQKQYSLLLRRTFQELWRSPSYIWSKFGLCFGIALFVGMSLWMSEPSLQSFQTQLFSLFLIFTIGNSGMKQIIYAFCSRRDLFEAREGPSKLYSKQVFILASITAELPWQSLTAIPVFLLWYFPTGIYLNAEGTERAERGTLLFLLLWVFFLFMATFAVMVASGLKHAPIAANIAVVLYQLMLLFCGVLAAPSSIPRFWIFMYRVSPLTYLVSGMMSASIAHTPVTCLPSETIKFDPPQNISCENYMAKYLEDHQGYLLDPESAGACQFCAWSTTDTYLAQLNIHARYQWRDLGIFTCFIFVNMVLALLIYSLVGRDKSKQKKVKKEHGK